MLELPFTTEQFLEVFRNYNQAIWPVQIVAYVLGALVVLTITWKKARYNKIVSVVLVLFWLWTGGIYHILFFSEINPVAYIFGILFIIQSILFLSAGVVQDKLHFELRGDAYGITGTLLIVYAMVLYPFLGMAAGHTYPFTPMFGVTPCPTTIFTFGLLLWTVKKVPGWLLIIPGAWSVVGITAALQLNMYEDTGLLVAGLITIPMLIYRDRILNRDTVAFRNIG